jgi:hypothetical protein
MTEIKIGSKVELKPSEYVNESSPTGLCTVVDMRGKTHIRLDKHTGFWQIQRFDLVKETPVKTNAEGVEARRAAFDPTKPVQTRDGHKARIVCTDYKGGGPILGLVSNLAGNAEAAYAFNLDGTHVYGGKQHDLMNVPEKRWINLYQDGCGIYYRSERDAENNIDKFRFYIKTLEVELG